MQVPMMEKPLKKHCSKCNNMAEVEVAETYKFGPLVLVQLSRFFLNPFNQTLAKACTKVQLAEFETIQNQTLELVGV